MGLTCTQHSRCQSQFSWQIWCQFAALQGAFSVSANFAIQQNIPVPTLTYTKMAKRLTLMPKQNLETTKRQKTKLGCSCLCFFRFIICRCSVEAGQMQTSTFGIKKIICQQSASIFGKNSFKALCVSYSISVFC